LRLCEKLFVSPAKAQSGKDKSDFLLNHASRYQIKDFTNRLDRYLIVLGSFKAKKIWVEILQLSFIPKIETVFF